MAEPKEEPVPRCFWRRLPVLPAGVLLAVLATVLATYWPALSAGALYMDDRFYIGNPVIQQPSWSLVWRIFGEVLSPSLVNGYYQPLSLLSVMLDFLDPAAMNSLLPFHRTTLLLHLLNVALVAGLLRVLFGNWLVSGLLALLYGVHPLNADAVLWIAERKTVLSTLLALGSLLCYVAYAQHVDRTHHRDWKRYGAALFLYVCALLSKPTALPLVALLLVLDYWPLGRLSRRALLEKIPFLLVASLSAVVTVISQARAGQAGGTQVMNFLYLPFVVSYTLGLYLRKTVWPSGLVSDYPLPHPFAPNNIEVLATVGGVLLVLAALLLSVRRSRAWLAGGLFFLCAILPALGIIRYTSSLAANRSMYLPMVGLLLPLGWGLGRLWNRDLGASKAVTHRLVLVGAGALLALGSAWTTRAYVSHWSDTVTLLRYYLTQTPNEWKLHNRLGTEWIQRRDYTAAIAEFREAVRLQPQWAENRLNLGRALFTVGELAEAKREFAAALRETPNDWRAHMLMGTALSGENDLAGALAEFRTAARLAPTQAPPHFDIARTLAEQGKLAEAADEYRHTLRLAPMHAGAMRGLAAITSK